MTIVGWKILYADGTVVTSKESSWHASKSEEVLIVSIYFIENYRRYTSNNEWVTENYKEELLQEDYYWISPDKTLGCGAAKDVPEGLPDGAVKTGILIQDMSWLERYNSFHEDRIW